MIQRTTLTSAAAFKELCDGNSELILARLHPAPHGTCLSATEAIARDSVTQAQLELVQIIRELGFGRIERLSIRFGQPHFDPPPRMVQEIKLGADAGRAPDAVDPELTPKEEFIRLFDLLAQIAASSVDIEVRHGLPFRITLERPYRRVSP